MHNYNKLAPLIIVMLVVMNNIAESLFSIQLPMIQNGLGVGTQTIEWLISMYLLGFSIGMLCWGHISDTIGRQRAWSIGVLASVLSFCTMFLFSSHTLFFIARFIQGFSNSVSGVMSLIIIRDLYDSPHDRSKMHALINQSLSIAPATCFIFSYIPLLNQHWHNSFILLACVYGTMFILLQSVNINVPFTPKNSLWQQCKEVISVKNTQKSILLIGMAIGFAKCYLSEMPVILKNITGHSEWFGYSLIGVSAAWLLGAQGAKYYSRHYGQYIPLYIGTLWACICSIVMLMISMYNHNFYTPLAMMGLTIIAMIGTGVIMPNAMALAMESHSTRAGVASSLIAFSFYIIATLLQFLLTFMPHDVYYSMPLLFTIASACMLLIAHFYQQSSTEPVDKSVENFDFPVANLDD